MSSRRDFLKGFAALASGLVLARRETLAEVARLGTPQQWVEPSTYTAIRSGRWNDPTIWSAGRVPGAGARVEVRGHTLTLDEVTPPLGPVDVYGATLEVGPRGLLRLNGETKFTRVCLLMDRDPWHDPAPAPAVEMLPGPQNRLMIFDTCHMDYRPAMYAPLLPMPPILASPRPEPLRVYPSQYRLTAAACPWQTTPGVLS
jgi:hypothetical protein